ncbi:NmrA/HSCARG family protein [Micromonospora sp. NBC_01796]|uniref:NmrA/HSCARG family protein n=1 Tax=Micromonospora sp. NBC_01796 TaxID=2975987 RepID=UPI002DD95D7D|nr:NmrA/HSCARG family protein [Micromonospora sp. NBC_01796]WSA84427.1 NmrA/HSCARG family protein [Micromonospora sp. NBC_01796]
MTEKKVIAVVGATGAQGGAAARAILADGEFAVRAITRNPDSEQARVLADLGAEVVEADLYDRASLEKAFDGAYGAFAVTFFWAHMSAERELTEARNLAEAAKFADLRHVVWSTLEDTRESIPLTDDRMPTLDGRFKVPHFDAKAEADSFFATAGVPTTYLRTTFYWDNLLSGVGPQRDESGQLVLGLPMLDSRIAGITAEDIGKSVLGILKSGTDLVDRTVGIAGEFLTGTEIAATYSRVLGEEVVYRPLTHDAYRALGFPAAVEYGNMFQYYAEFPEAFLGRRDLGFTRTVNPSVQTLEQFLTAHRNELTAG